MHRRVEIRDLVDEREHGRDRGLAVAARNGNDLVEPRRKLPQRDAALELRNAMFASVDTLRIVRLDRRGIDDQIGVCRLLGPMSVVYGDAVLFEPVGELRLTAVASRDLMPLRLQDPRDAAHAAAADPDAMNPFCLVQ